MSSHFDNNLGYWVDDTTGQQVDPSTGNPYPAGATTDTGASATSIAPTAGNTPGITINGQAVTGVTDPGGAGGAGTPVDAAGNNPWTTAATPAPTDPSADVLSSPLLAPWTIPFNYTPFSGPTYQAPTLAGFYSDDPGLQARLQLGETAEENSAASKGTLLNAGTTQAENQAAQDYASNEYGNYVNQTQSNFNTLYNSDLSSWTQNYNAALQQYQQAYNIYTNNQNNAFNKLDAVTNGGQTAVNSLNSTALGFSQLGSSTAQTGATGQGNNVVGAGNATAAGTVGAANQWASLLGTGTNIGSFYAQNNNAPGT